LKLGKSLYLVKIVQRGNGRYLVQRCNNPGIVAAGSAKRFTRDPELYREFFSKGKAVDYIEKQGNMVLIHAGDGVLFKIVLDSLKKGIPQIAEEISKM
jgi:hypothetical protein